jgi:anti-sigma regulatory factor (Ser/Thr protein kinase)
MVSDFHIRLPPDAGQLAPLRRSLADWLAHAEVEPNASAAVVLATHEAAANAIEHAQAEVVVTVSRDRDRMTVVVRNAGGWKESDEDEYRGRGLILMRGLMSQVEVGSHPDGSVVRMQLSL